MPVATKPYSPLVLVDTADLSEENWLEYRRRGIGGSDAAAVLGVSPFATARDLYYDKLKLISYEDRESNWVAKKMGHLLEDLVAQIFHVKTGYRIYQIKKMFYHPIHTFMLADIDYFIELPNGETAILEIKTTNYNAKDHWWSGQEEIVPINYEVQGRHYMCVMNVDHVYYCCLYGNNENEVIIRHIDRDLDYEDELIALEQNFWNGYILTQTPPPYTEDGDLIIESAKRHFGPADPNAPTILLGVRLSACVLRYLELQAEKNVISAEAKRIEGEMKRLQGQIVAEMGRSCTAACSPGGASYSITYNPIRKPGISKDNLLLLQAQHPDIYDEYVTVSESRRFYIKEQREEAA
jgi:putative phage-type endonuclease